MSSNIITVRKVEDRKIKQLIQVNGANTFYSDEPEPVGNDEGPNPHDLLNAALGACTGMTVMMVAQRKQWPLQDVKVEITHSEDDATYRIQRRIELVGEALTAEQRTYRMGIANKCPIHKALHKKFEIATELAGA